MDYSDINNLLGNLELDNQGHNHMIKNNQVHNQTLQGDRGGDHNIHESNKSLFKPSHNASLSSFVLTAGFHLINVPFVS